MCAILDANAAHQLFGSDRPPAGKAFFDWIESGTGKLIVGGKLRQELYEAGCGEWLRGAILAGDAIEIDDAKVDREKETLEDQALCRSDDPHVIALARLGGARLLYSNDRKLHRDFKDRNLIDGPQGKIYSTLKSGKLTTSKKTLLRQNTCPA